MTRYTIIWGHSGTQGREWSTAREASRYAATVWGRIDAADPADAIAQLARELPVGDWHAYGRAIHIIAPATDSEVDHEQD